MERWEEITNKKSEFLMENFKGRTDVFAEQRQDGSYFPVRRELLTSDIVGHLKGEKTLGIYPVFSQNNLVNFLVIDIDTEDASFLNEIIKACMKAGIKRESLLIERSGMKGYHIWIFFSKSITAMKAKRLGKFIVADINGEVEVFPKQDKVNDVGSLVKLPLGVHKKTGHRSCFLCEDGKIVEDWEFHLQNIFFVSEEEVDLILQKDEETKENYAVEISSDNSGSSKQNRVLPCFEKILKNGVNEGKRDNVGFRLAIYLKYKGLPAQGVVDIMRTWNSRNRPPLPIEAIDKIVHSVYEKDYANFGCDESFMSEFCQDSCPIRRKQELSQIVVNELDADDVEESDAESEVDISPMPSSLVPEGFLRDYTNFVGPLSEAPLQFHIASGLVLVAVACGRKIFYRQGANKIFPNPYILVVGRSGIARKTTALTPAFKMINALDPDLYLGSIMSLEAFYDALQSHPNKFGYYSEFKTFLENCSKKYGEGLIAAMTDAYDCPDRLKINLKSIPHEKRFILEPYLSILAATNSSWFQIKEADITGGFLGRFLIIMAGERDRLLPRPPAMDEAQLEAMVDRLRCISGLSGEFVFTEEAGKEFDRIYADVAERQQQLSNKTILEPFWSRIGTSIIKLAMIYKISRCGSDFRLDIESVKWAYDVMSYVIRYYQYVVSRVTSSEFKKIEQKTVDMLKEVKEKGITRSKLLKVIDTDSKRCDVLVRTLKEKGLLVEKEWRTKTKKGHIYYLPKYCQR